jgi:hypothetical protein
MLQRLLLQVQGWKGGRVEGWEGCSIFDGWVDGWKGGRMDGWEGGRVDERSVKKSMRDYYY